MRKLVLVMAAMILLCLGGVAQAAPIGGSTGDVLSYAVVSDPQPIQAVPEPGTIMAAMALLAPAGLMFRRRRA